MTTIGRRIVVALVAAPLAAGAIATAVGGPSHAGRPPAAHVSSPAGQAGPGGGGASSGKSHTVARMVAGHMVYHLVPHVPYVFRPRIFRGPRLFRR